MCFSLQAKHPRALVYPELRKKLEIMRAKSSNSIAPGVHAKDGEIRIALRNAISDALLESCGTVDSTNNNFVPEESPVAPVEDAVVIVCGSAFIMAEARSEIGIVEPKDGDILLMASAYGSGGASLRDAQVIISIITYKIFTFFKEVFKNCGCLY